MQPLCDLSGYLVEGLVGWHDARATRSCLLVEVHEAHDLLDVGQLVADHLVHALEPLQG